MYIAQSRSFRTFCIYIDKSFIAKNLFYPVSTLPKKKYLNITEERVVAQANFFDKIQKILTIHTLKIIHKILETNSSFPVK